MSINVQISRACCKLFFTESVCTTSPFGTILGGAVMIVLALAINRIKQNGANQNNAVQPLNDRVAVQPVEEDPLPPQEFDADIRALIGTKKTAEERDLEILKHFNRYNK